MKYSSNTAQNAGTVWYIVVNIYQIPRGKYRAKCPFNKHWVQSHVAAKEVTSLTVGEDMMTLIVSQTH